MKVKGAAVYGAGLMLFLAVPTSHYEFILIYVISVTPTLVLYANTELKDLHKNPESWSGIKALIHPVVLFGILTFTHHLWMPTAILG